MKNGSQPKKRYFAAANSADGFVNYFPFIFGAAPCRRLFVIRGGPGTGKSSFMRRVANAAENAGIEVTYYHCSSDAESLDGLFLEGTGIGFVDGTAPHPWEPTLPGAFEETVDLGRFWRAELLAMRRDEIERLVREKKQGYARAYGYLSAFGATHRAMEDRLREAVDGEKLRRAAERLLASCNVPCGAFSESIGLCDSFGMAGRVRFDTYETSCARHVFVGNTAGMGHLFLGALYEACRRRGVSVRVSRDPLLPERIDALALTDAGISFSLRENEEDERAVNMERFLSRRALGTARAVRRACEAACDHLLSLAAEELARVRDRHFALEAIYGAAMDFEAKERFEETFLPRLL